MRQRQLELADFADVGAEFAGPHVAQRWVGRQFAILANRVRSRGLTSRSAERPNPADS